MRIEGARLQRYGMQNVLRFAAKAAREGKRTGPIGREMLFVYGPKTLEAIPYEGIEVKGKRRACAIDINDILGLLALTGHELRVVMGGKTKTFSPDETMQLAAAVEDALETLSAQEIGILSAEFYCGNAPKKDLKTKGNYSHFVGSVNSAFKKRKGEEWNAVQFYIGAGLGVVSLEFGLNNYIEWVIKDLSMTKREESSFVAELVLGQAGRSRYDTENVGAFAGELVRGRKYNLCETAALAKKTIEAMGYDEQQAGVFASALGETLNYNIHQSGEFIIILTHGWGIEQKARFVAEFARGEKKDVAAILEWLIIAERKISALFSAGHEKAGRFPNVATAMAATGLKNPDDVQREFFALGFEAGRGATKKAEEGKNWEGKDLRWWGRFVAHLAEEERYDEGPTRNLIVKAMGLISTWGEEEAGGFLAGAIKARKGDERQMGKSAARIIDKTTLDFDQDAPYIVGFIAAEKYEEEQSIAFIEGWVKGMVYDEKQTGRLAAGVAESKAYNKREEILFAARLAIGLGYNQKQTAKFVAGVLEERGDNSGAEAERFIADFAKEKGWGEKETTKFAALIEKETPADAFSTGVFIANLARARKLSERGTGKLVADFSAAKGGRRKEEYDLAIFVAGEKQYSEKQTAAFSASMAIESGYNEQRVRELAEHIAAHRKYGLESFYGEILKKINDFFNEDKTGELYLSWLIGGTT